MNINLLKIIIGSTIILAFQFFIYNILYIYTPTNFFLNYNDACLTLIAWTVIIFTPLLGLVFIRMSIITKWKLVIMVPLLIFCLVLSVASYIISNINPFIGNRFPFNTYPFSSENYKDNEHHMIDIGDRVGCSELFNEGYSLIGRLNYGFQSLTYYVYCEGTLTPDKCSAFKATNVGEDMLGWDGMGRTAKSLKVGTNCEGIFYGETLDL